MQLIGISMAMINGRKDKEREKERKRERESKNNCNILEVFACTFLQQFALL